MAARRPGGSVVIEDLSRLVLATACFGSAIVAVVVARRGQVMFRWLMVFIAHWSLWFGTGMLALLLDSVTLGLGDPLFVAGLNSSAAATVGGWTAAALVNYQRSRKGLSRIHEFLDAPDGGALLVQSAEK